MSGTGIAYPADAVSGSPQYAATQGRGAFAAAMGGATSGRPLGGASGVRPGTPTNTITATSTTWTMNPNGFGGYIDLHTSATNGGYFFAFSGTITGSVTAAGGSPRTDIVWVQVNDSNTGDASSGAPRVVLDYTANTTTPPARAFVIAQINVPATGGGSPTVSWVAPVSFAAGGTPSIGSVAGRAATFPTPAGGETLYRSDKLYFERYSAAASLWQPFGATKVVTLAAAASPLPTSFADFSGSGLTFTVDTNTQVRALLDFGGQISMTATATANIALNIDGTDVRIVSLGSGSGQVALANVASKWLATLAAGAHTIKLRGSSNVGSVASVGGGFLIVTFLDLDPSL